MMVLIWVQIVCKGFQPLTYNKSPLERRELHVKLKFHVGLSMAWFDFLRPTQQFFSHFGTGLNQ